jgi:hypothetical protein
MRKIYCIATILIFVIINSFQALSVLKVANAQQVKQPVAGEPNGVDLATLLQKEFEAARAAAMRDTNYVQNARKTAIYDLNEADKANLIQKEIEANNEHYKDRVLGNPFRGLALSIASMKDK